APLLRRSPKSLKRELIQHSIILSGAFIVVAIARRLQGESRIAELNLSTFIKIITDTILGPLVSIGTFIIRPVNAIADFNMAWLIPLAAGCIAIAYLISQSPFFDRARQAITFSPDDGDSNKLQSEQSRIFRELARWALIGLVMLMLAYPLTLIGEVTDIDGRASRVHVAAIIGASILWACVCTAIAFIASRYQKRQLANLGLAIYFTLLLGFGLTIQQDFKTAWQYQRAFWTDVVNLCPDMTYGTVILIEDYGLKEPKQILTRG
ncbi:MAG TPA: hypothetical protein DEV81_09080, partial [Cyanobacteria bacterium UBA11049]|nr:hypothetical protein [Cyanobacteria bacterium UBA11049]